MVGIPVVFLRSDVLARADPSTWMSGLPVPALDQVAATGTVRHEIRHFHDALLAPPLLATFFTEIQRNWLSARIIASGAVPGGPLDDELAEDLAGYRALVDAVARAYPVTRRKVTVERITEPIGYLDLLETSAVTSELRTVFAALGTGAQEYWERLREALPTRYKRILGASTTGDGDLPDTLERLSRRLMWCLYTHDEPLDRFAHLASLPPAEADRLCTPDAIRADLQQTLVEPHVWAAPMLANDYFLTTQDIHHARVRCATAMIDGEFSLERYTSGIAAFPVPPVCFFPDDRMAHERRIPYVRKRTLREAYGDVFAYHYMRDAQRRTALSAGIVPAPGLTSFVALNKIDTMLQMRYRAQHWFGDRVTYGQHLDDAFSAD